MCAARMTNRFFGLSIPALHKSKTATLCIRSQVCLNRMDPPEKELDDAPGQT